MVFFSSQPIRWTYRTLNDGRRIRIRDTDGHIQVLSPNIRDGGNTHYFKDDVTNSNFKVGDNVELICNRTLPVNGKYGPINKGAKGIVVRIAETGTIGVSFTNFKLGHDCNQSATVGTGLYIKPNELIKVAATIEEEFKQLYDMEET